jgi:hypothetical protein
MTDRLIRPLCVYAFAGILCAVIVGCSNSGSGSRSDEAANNPLANVEFPEGDPSVSAADGGPGFTGEGWTTVKPYPLGDVRAVKGGAIRSSIREWPGNLRIVGTASNTQFNSIVEDFIHL